MKVIKKTLQYGEHTLTIETGVIAKQATGSVMVSMGDTMVLVTVVAAKEAAADQDFFPLTVNYQERYYAAGRIPGGFVKREGRPSVQETLTSRLIDRPIRPLFPEHFKNEVQIIATVMSIDPQISPDIPALIGASAALMISGVPFQGPIAAARVGYRDGTFLLNPNTEELKTSALELVVAGTADAVLMVESEAKELPEATMLDAVMFGHKAMQSVIQIIKEIAEEAGKDCWVLEPKPSTADLENKIADQFANEIKAAYSSTDKEQRKNKIKDLLKKAVENHASKADNDNLPSSAIVGNIFHKLEKKLIREKIIAEKIRIDGRDLKTVRPIDINVKVFPRTHGSACFTRGETQALVIATLATEKGAQIIDAPVGETQERFMLHYNFPPYCTGETGIVGSPKRREIGHGNLARRALSAVVPPKETFPYVIRAVSEITESNGSSSMATVCGTTLALMDAGVPIKAPVAGIAMGLIKEPNSFAVLTDILGEEDHFGDMDFKVAGTYRGVTALQMDIKISGITKEIMEIALNQAKEGRIHILNLMLEKISRPRESLSDFAPTISTLQIATDKIRDVIGKGGVTIRNIVETTGADINIDDNGTVTIAAVGKESSDKAIARIKEITAEPEVGKIYTGLVVKITDFGAFVNFMPNRDGLVHISQIVNRRIEKVEDVLHEGQEVKVKVLEVDRQGKVRLSMKEVPVAEENAQ